MGFNFRDLLPAVGSLAGGFFGGPMGASAGGAVGNMFTRDKSGEGASKYLDQVQGYGRQAYNPFINQGREAYGQLGPKYKQMVNDPYSMYNEDVDSYKPSAQYEFMQPRLSQAMGNTAAAGGFVGNDADQMSRAQLVQQMLGSDLGSYLDRINGMRGAGMAGLEGSVDRGFGASSNLADYLGNAAGNQAGLSASMGAQKQKGQSNNINDLISNMTRGFGGQAGQSLNSNQTQLPKYGNSSGFNMPNNWLSGGR